MMREKTKQFALPPVEQCYPRATKSLQFSLSNQIEQLYQVFQAHVDELDVTFEGLNAHNTIHEFFSLFFKNTLFENREKVRQIKQSLEDFYSFGKKTHRLFFRLRDSRLKQVEAVYLTLRDTDLYESIVWLCSQIDHWFACTLAWQTYYRHEFDE